MGKKKNEWKIDEWDESLDSGRKPGTPDPFGIPGTTGNNRSSEWDWPEEPKKTPSRKQREKREKGGMPKWLIPTLAGIAAAAVIAVFAAPKVMGFFRTGGGSGNPTPGVIVTGTAAPTDTPAPRSTDTPTPRPTATPTQRPTNTPTQRPTDTPTPRPTDTPTPAPSALDQNEWYGKEFRFRYQNLTDHEKEIYERIYEGILDCRSSIPVPAFTETELNHVSDVLHLDTPEFFHWAGSCTYSYVGTRYTYEPDYRMSKSEYETIKTHIHGLIRELQAQMPAGADDYQKEMILNNWLVDHCEYEYDRENLQTAYADASLYYGRAQCSGYSEGFTLLMRAFGIQCMAVVSSTHEWNIARINGRWYQVDVTWNDINVEGGTEGDRFYSWFNVPDRLVAEETESHIMEAESRAVAPACTSLEDNYVFREGVYIASGSSDPAKELHDGVESARARGKKTVVFMVDDAGAIANWDNIFARFYDPYGGYGWSLYTPGNNRSAFAVWSD